MDTQPSAPITRLLVQWGQGEEECLGQLMPLVQSELRRIARRYMRMESPGHTLQTTALINEAYLRLVDQDQANWQNRAQFFRALSPDHAPHSGRSRACIAAREARRRGATP